MLSIPDAAVIVGLGILLFGSQKIPELARALRRSGQEFKAGHAEAAGPSPDEHRANTPPAAGETGPSGPEA